MKIYYAHSLHLYNTEQEKRDIVLLESLGFEVINPNTEEVQKQYEKYKEDMGFRYFKMLIDLNCNALAFRAYPDYTIGSGVYQEIKWAKELKLPIIELPGSLLRRSLTLDQTREYLSEIGQR